MLNPEGLKKSNFLRDLQLSILGNETLIVDNYKYAKIFNFYVEYKVIAVDDNILYHY